MNASSVFQPYTVEYDASHHKMQFSAASSFALQWFSGGPYQLLGFLPLDTSYATSHESIYAVQMSRPFAISISISALDSVMYTGARIFSSTFLVPMKEGPSYVNYYENQQPMEVTVSPRSFDRFQVKIQDPLTGGLLDFNNANWVMSLTLK